jgi:uncharacterized protein YqgV (UPF0045/DUF77 family)
MADPLIATIPIQPTGAAMRIAVEISLYPLNAEYIPPIKDFIDRLAARPGLAVLTNAMSTQIAGEHALVFAALADETATTFAAPGRAVFVMKVLGGATEAAH